MLMFKPDGSSKLTKNGILIQYTKHYKTIACMTMAIGPGRITHDTGIRTEPHIYGTAQSGLSSGDNLSQVPGQLFWSQFSSHICVLKQDIYGAQGSYFCDVPGRFQ